MPTEVAERVPARARRLAVCAGVPILASKITAPSVPDWVLPRPRITKLIADGTQWCRLTVVTGPAGAGKTIALALWAAAQPGRVAWVSVDEFDNRPRVFWSYAVAALRRSGVPLPTALPATRGRDAGHVFLLWLAAALAAQDPPVTLVLDDLHLLTDPTVQAELDYLLRNVGPGLRLMVSARMDTLPVHRYRLAGELTEIRARDLAFTVAEAGELLARHGVTLPADSLAGAMIGLTAALRSGDLTAAGAAAVRAEALASRVPGDQLARHPDIRARVLSGRGAVELWSGHLDEAARTLESGAAASAGQAERAGCLGHLALVEALRGRLGRAAQLAAGATAALTAAGQRPPAPHPGPAALVALAWVHLEHHELREARDSLSQADAALDVSPDKLTGAVAYLVAAGGSLAEGRAATAGQIIARARSGWSVPAWLDQKLSLVQSRACAAAGDIAAALAAAGCAGSDTSPEAAVTLAHARAAAGDAENARRALAPVLAADSGAPERVRLHAWLVDARLSYTGGDRARGRRSLASALRLAEPEQLRLPFVLERGWIEPVLRSDPALARSHWRLFSPAGRRGQLPAPRGSPDQAPILVVESLSAREREVLRRLSGLLSNAEIASELDISIHTVKTHLKNICRKLAVTRRGEAVRRARQLELI